MYGVDIINAETFRCLINRATEKLLTAQHKVSLFLRRRRDDMVAKYEAMVRRWEKVVSWLNLRLRAFKSRHGRPDRKRFVTERIVPLEDKGFYAGQPVCHRCGIRGIVLNDEAPAGFIAVREETDSPDSQTKWRISQTRIRKGVYASLLGLDMVTA